MKTGKARGATYENAELSTIVRIATEIQTPLGVIISAGELLESYFDRLTADRRRLALEDILAAARQMNAAMNQLTATENKSQQYSKTATLNHSRL